MIELLCEGCKTFLAYCALQGGFFRCRKLFIALNVDVYLENPRCATVYSTPGPHFADISARRPDAITRMSRSLTSLTKPLCRLGSGGPVVTDRVSSLSSASAYVVCGLHFRLSKLSTLLSSVPLDRKPPRPSRSHESTSQPCPLTTRRGSARINRRTTARPPRPWNGLRSYGLKMVVSCFKPRMSSSKFTSRSSRNIRQSSPTCSKYRTHQLIQQWNPVQSSFSRMPRKTSNTYSLSSMATGESSDVAIVRALRQVLSPGPAWGVASMQASTSHLNSQC